MDPCTGFSRSKPRKSGVGNKSSARTEVPHSLAKVDSKATFIARLTDSSAMEDLAQNTRPRVLGIHHLKFAVSNLDVSIAWYERVLGARRIPSLDHLRSDGIRFAAVLQMGDWSDLFLELRLSESRAQKDRGWDPVTLSVRGREDLVLWTDWLDRWGTTHSPLLIGARGWVLVFEDPDGRRMRIYTKEEHGGTQAVSTNDPWLNEPWA